MSTTLSVNSKNLWEVEETVTDEWLQSEINRAKREDEASSRGESLIMFAKTNKVTNSIKRNEENINKTARLQLHMELTYAQFREQKEARTLSVSPRSRDQVVDVSTLLPPNYNPKNDPIPPPATQRPSKKRPAAALAARIAKEKALQLQQKKQQQQQQKQREEEIEERKEANKKDPTSPLTAPLDSTATGEHQGGEGKDSLPPENMAEKQMMERKQAFKQFMVAIRGLGYISNLAKIVIEDRKARKRAARRIQKWSRVTIPAYIKARFWMNMKWPLLFTTNLRVRRKNMAVDKIKKFFKECYEIPPQTKARNFMSLVRKCQRFLRGFCLVAKARRELLSLYWQKVEKLVRAQILAREKRAAAKMKREALLRMLNQDVKGHGVNIHAQWAQKQAEVTALLMHSDIIQQYYRQQNHRAILREAHEQHAAAIAEEAAGRDADGADEGNNNINDGEGAMAVSAAAAVAAAPTFSANGEEIDEALRDKIIDNTLRLKRKIHVDMLRKAVIDRARSRGTVTEDLAKKFLRAQTSDTQRQVYEEMNLAMVAGKEFDIDSGPRPGFYCLTDSRLGQTWRSVIEEHVRYDIEEKKKMRA